MIFATPNRGTGGAGAGGLIKGMMAGEQSRQNDQRMDWLQTQQDRQTEQYETEGVQSRMYDIFEARKAGSNIAPLVDDLTKWKKTTTNFNDGKDFRVGSWDEYKDADGTYTMEGINRIQSNTGQPFIAGETDAQQPFMLDDMLVDEETFKAGAPKYKTYSDNRTLQNDLLKAQIKKAEGGETKQSDADALTDAKAVKKYYEDNNLEVPISINDKVDILETKLKISKPQAVDKISSGVFNEPIDNWQKNGGVLTKDVRDEARKTQNRAEYKMEGRKELNGEIAGYGAMNDAKKKVFQILDSKEGMLTGVIQTKELDALKRKEDWKSLDKGQKQKALNSVFAKSTLGTAVSNYLKEISGSAVAEEEYQRIYDALTGGEGANPETLKAALGGSVSSMRDTVQSKVEGIGKNYPNSRIEMWDNFLDAKDREVNAFEDVPKAKETGGKSTASKAASEVPAELAEDVIDAGVNIVKSTYNKLTADKKTKTATTPKEVLNMDVPGLVNHLTKTLSKEEAQKFIDDNYHNMTPVQLEALRAL